MGKRITRDLGEMVALSRVELESITYKANALPLSYRATYYCVTSGTPYTLDALGIEGEGPRL